MWWAESLDRHHWAPELGGCCLSADDASDIIIRTIAAHDDATPNANATMLGHLMALHLITGEERYRERAEQLYAGQRGVALESQVSHTGFLSSVIDLMEPPHVVESVKPGEVRPGDRIGSRKLAEDGRAAEYVCSGAQCLPPVSEPGEQVSLVRPR